MKVFLAGIQGRYWLLERWKSISQAGTENGKSSQREREREYGYLHGWRHNGQPISVDEANNTHTHTHNADISRRGASRQEWSLLTHSLTHRPLVLESFFYCRKNEVVPKLLPTLGGFLLDSGAFTFIQGKTSVNWDEYTEEYAEWIKAYNIEHFFELDIDSIVGLKKVERLRSRLEQLTGKQPIPVWHKSRGKDYFLSTCKDYKYVAIGGLVGNSDDVPDMYMPWFINEAHKAGAKIHGLGFTKIEKLKQFHFDSVDSTAWLYGNRGGFIYVFDSEIGNFRKINKKQDQRLKSQEAALYNFNEWIKFQKWALKNL